MRCIYFIGKLCKANPPINNVSDYPPNKKEKEKYCENSKFLTCPRFGAYLYHLRATKKLKEGESPDSET